MYDPEQIMLFEEGLYLGTSSWSYADWEGTVNPSLGAPDPRVIKERMRGALRLTRDGLH